MRFVSVFLSFAMQRGLLNVRRPGGEGKGRGGRRRTCLEAVRPMLPLVLETMTTRGFALLRRSGVKARVTMALDVMPLLKHALDTALAEGRSPSAVETSSLIALLTSTDTTLGCQQHGNYHGLR